MAGKSMYKGGRKQYFFYLWIYSGTISSIEMQRKLASDQRLSYFIKRKDSTQHFLRSLYFFQAKS